SGLIIAPCRLEGGLTGLETLVESSTRRTLLLKRLVQACFSGAGLTQCSGCVAQLTLERLPRGRDSSDFRDELRFAAGETRDLGLRGPIVAAGSLERRACFVQAPGKTLALCGC